MLSEIGTLALASAACHPSAAGCHHHGKYDATVHRLWLSCHTGLHRPPGTFPDPGSADSDTERSGLLGIQISQPIADLCTFFLAAFVMKGIFREMGQ